MPYRDRVPIAKTSTKARKAIARPTSEIELAGKTYTALCPKVAFILKLHTQISLLTAQGPELEQLSDSGHLLILLVEKALGPDSWAEIQARLDDNADDLDDPDLWIAGNNLLDMWAPWIKARMKDVGMKLAKTDATAG